MGALDDGQFILELVDGVSVGMGFEPEILQIEEAVKVLLQGLGEDINREGLRKTPARVAKALSEGTRGYRQKAKDIVQGALFPEVGLDDGVGHAGGVGGLVIVRDLDLFSYCESCLLPFQVKCHVGYVPSGQRVVGLSKLSRVADVFAKRLQDPQRLADEVCSALNHGIKPAGVAVVLQCLHMHFLSLELGCLDSNHQEWVKVSVCSGKGLFESTKAAIWSDFLNLLKFRGINVEKTSTRDSTSPWCPSQSSFASTPCKIEPVHQMVAAVTSILKSLGEDPSRKELVGSPDRYVGWLKNFERADLGLKLNGHVCDQMNPFQPNCSKEEMQSELNLSFWSLCEHHLLPFHGVVHIGYFCSKGTNPIARSTLESIVNFYGFKLQVQERLTRQVSETVSYLLGGGDVIVVVEASHSCMVSRGIEKLGSNTATMALLGRFSSDDAAKNMFLQSIQNISTS